MFEIRKKILGQIWVQIYKEGLGREAILRIEKQQLIELLRVAASKESSLEKKEDYAKLQDAMPGVYAIIFRKKPDRLEICYTSKSFGLRSGEAVVTENSRLFNLIKSLFKE